MFLSAVAQAWARRVPVLARTPGPRIRAWIQEFSKADEGAARALLGRADRELAEAAAAEILADAREATAAGAIDKNGLVNLGSQLLAIADGGPALAEEAVLSLTAHGHFLAGLGHHLDEPLLAERAYRIAEWGYRSCTQPSLARLCDLAASAIGGAALVGDDPDIVSRRCEDLRAVDPELAQEITPSLDGYMRALDLVRRIRGGASPTLRDTNGLDPEGSALLRLAALYLAELEPDAARDLAAMSDDVASRFNLGTTALIALATVHIKGTRWMAAVKILEPLVQAGPFDVSTVTMLATAMANEGEWPRARALLLDHINDPPLRSDLELLGTLILLAASYGDAQLEQWRGQLRALDPEADPLPVPRSGHVVIKPLLAKVVGDNQVVVSHELLNLPEDEQQAQMFAAMIAEHDDVPASLDALRDQHADMFPVVKRLLTEAGFTVTRAEQHYRTAEGLFEARRFEAAIGEYEAALAEDDRMALARDAPR
jgi:tetratricopeptide (TPR) repeat protein